jgi:hypothetical protein
MRCGVCGITPTHVFSDKDANQVHAEVAAKPR